MECWSDDNLKEEIKVLETTYTNITFPTTDYTIFTIYTRERTQVK